MMNFERVKNRLRWLEKKLGKEFIHLKMPDGSVESIPNDSEAIVRAMFDFTDGHSNSLAEKIGRSVSDDSPNQMTNLVRALFKGPITREEVWPDESSEAKRSN